MKKALILACSVMIFQPFGAVGTRAPKGGAKPLWPSEGVSALHASLQAMLREGGELFHAGRYLEARNRFETLRKSALDVREFSLAARATGNLGGCQFALRQYPAALHSFLEARRLAGLTGDVSTVAACDANIASLYSEMGDLKAGVEWMKGTMERLSGNDRRDHLALLLIQMASLRARQGRMAEALGLFRQGIDAADRAGNLEYGALGWNRLGEELLRRGEIAAAERPLLEAYHIRKLHHLAMDSSYCNLGRLRLAQGDLASASVLLDRAVELSARPEGAAPAKDVYLARGRVRLAQGRLRDALDDLRVATRLARAWRAAPPDDATRIGAEGLLDQIHTALIEAGNRLYLKTHDPALARETFEAAEEDRASSLRALVNGRRAASPELPAAYWEALARLQRAEIAVLRAANPRTEEVVRSARAELLRLDGSLEPASAPLTEGLLRRARQALEADSALLAFHLGDAVSWLWALDRNGLAVYALPGRAEIEPQIGQAVQAIREDTPEAVPAGARLYRTVFGPLAPRFRQRTHWLLALDRELFDVPVAALAEETQPATVYVAERRTTEVIPGAAYWLEAAARPEASSPVFLGLGDPIYNLADSRLPPPRPATRSAFFLGGFHAAAAGEAGPALPRLVASARELEACARAWNGKSVLLEGAAASRRNLEEQLRSNPSVVHLATHVLESSDGPAYGVIALSLAGDAPELVQPQEIARWKVRVGLVSLSGCHSAAGAALPATGLLGLTRAWLTAGADAVVSSRWSTPDDDGKLFSALYRNLRAQTRQAPGRALRSAQVEMIRGAGWRARPRYWGAYVVVGNE